MMLFYIKGYVESTYYTVIGEVLNDSVKEKALGGVIALSAIADLLCTPMAGTCMNNE